MNKKYLIIGGGIALLVILFIVVLLSFNTPAKNQQSVSQTVTVSSQNVNKKSTTTPSAAKLSGASATPVISMQPANTPQATVEQFYHYYFSSPTNPLAHGAYKNNPYLAPDFKGLIEAAYDNGNTPVFCPKDVQKKVVVGKEVAVDSANAILVDEVISQASPGGKDLYSVIVQNINNKWLIYDIHCL